MTNFHSIGSIYKGTEHFYISDHYLNKKKSLIYIGRNDREIFSIYEKLKWILQNENVLKQMRPAAPANWQQNENVFSSSSLPASFGHGAEMTVSPTVWASC